MPKIVHSYGPHLTRVRLEAAERLNRPQLVTVVGAAKYLGVGKSTLYHYEDGTRRPSLEQLEEMARGYGVMVGDLLPSRAVRTGEAAAILAPLPRPPQHLRGMFATQMAALADSFAAAYEEPRVQVLPQIDNTEVRKYPVTPSDRLVAITPVATSTDVRATKTERHRGQSSSKVRR